MEIKLNQVNKQFGQKKVLDDLNLTLKPKVIYGLFGENGAGKSTLLNVLTDRLSASTGKVIIDNQLNKNNDHVLGNMYLIGEANLYPNHLKISQIFSTTAQFYPGFGFELAHKLSGQFGISENTRLNKLSTGYRTIIKDIVALSVSANFIFLDEPTLGLDAHHRELLYSALMETYANRPRTFVISTHLIDEVANLVEKVLLLENGKLTINDTVENLLAKSYSITGPKKQVQAYTTNLNVIGHSNLGDLQTDYVFGRLNSKYPLPKTVKISKMDLQKLLVNLTKSKRGDLK